MEQVRGRPLIYLDNACMSLKPQAVIDAIIDYYRSGSGCHGRTDHLFGRRTTERYDRAREAIRKFLGAGSTREIVFTRNATESINLVARGLRMAAGERVLTTDIEHNSNLVPWHVLAAERGIVHRIVSTRADTTFDLEALAAAFAEGPVRLVSVLMTSNLTGVDFPVADICRIAHAHGALVMVDAAQAPLTHAIDVRAMGADFLALSSHKMLGPTGVGILYLREDLVDSVEPLVVGGEAVLDTTRDSHRVAPSPDRFEAGLRDYAGAYGAAAAARYVGELGPERIRAHVVSLNARATAGLLGIDGVRLLGPEDPSLRNGILNVVIDGIPPADLSRLLNDGANLMVRHGKHCVHSWYHHMDIPDSLRISFGPYNTEHEVDELVDHTNRILRHFR
jgi:cysteine desulfurase/selenocysteine lyase